MLPLEVFALILPRQRYRAAEKSSRVRDHTGNPKTAAPGEKGPAEPPSGGRRDAHRVARPSGLDLEMWWWKNDLNILDQKLSRDEQLSNRNFARDAVSFTERKMGDTSTWCGGARRRKLVEKEGRQSHPQKKSASPG